MFPVIEPKDLARFSKHSPDGIRQLTSESSFNLPDLSQSSCEDNDDNETFDASAYSQYSSKNGK